MKFDEELTARIALHKRAELETTRGSFSDEAYQELYAAVQEDWDTFLFEPSDRALKMVYDALLADDMARSEEEFMDDAAYDQARKKRYSRLTKACEDALTYDADCLDAKLIIALTASRESHVTRAQLSELVPQDENPFESLVKGEEGEVMGASSAAPAWNRDLTLIEKRPYLRVLAALARSCVECACYTQARTLCEQLIKLDPSDELGARYTLAIALARLEDEAAFNALDARFAHAGNAWSHLCRAILMYKLDRIDAARRALKGFASLCRGGAYALLRPIFVETYIPQRPVFETGTFEEAVLAVHECDPFIMDTPDFLGWAATQDNFTAQAKQFARENDLDW